LEKAKEELAAAEAKLTEATEAFEKAGQPESGPFHRNLDRALRGFSRAEAGVDTAQRGVDTAQRGVDTAQKGVDTAQNHLTACSEAVDALIAPRTAGELPQLCV
jgi:exonuclease VII small subunit